jgi:FKBP-type peptidyl-prolyl cis-trans isomerase
MKKLTNILKIGVLILFVGILAACNKDVEDPYAAYTPEREAGLIKDWLAAMVTKGNDIDTTDTGIFYINDTTKVGSGPTVVAGNTVTVKYTGMFLDGQVFDASAYHGDGTYTYKHKTDPLILGWEEGIEVLNKGASAAFLIPSAKAYGVRGQGSIPPNTPLIFIIEVVDIK